MKPKWVVRSEEDGEQKDRTASGVDRHNCRIEAFKDELQKRRSIVNQKLFTTV